MTWINDFKTYFTKNQLVFIFILLLCGLLLRWLQLDIRPFHHDESLHALYGKHMFQNPQILFYKYDPMLHGPLLYHLIPFFYELFGISKFAARMLPATLSTLLLFFPFSFYRHLNPRAFLLLLTFLSLSPSLIYWGRFLREDGLMILTFLIGVLAFIGKKESTKAFAITNLLLLPFTIKESAYIHPVLFFAFIFIDYLFESNKSESFFIQIKNIFIHGKLGAILATCLNIMLFIYLYTGGLRWADGLYQNMFTSGFTYWFAQHQKERIPGPFIFQTLILSSYDFVFFITILSCSIHLYLGPNKKLKWFWISSLALMALCYPLVKSFNFSSGSFWQWSKFKIPADIYFFILIFINGAISSILLIRKRLKILAFLNYSFWAFLFTYSFLGERVPWLAIYPLFFGLFFVAFYLNDLKLIKTNKFRYFLIITFIFTLRVALKCNFSEAGFSNQLISQVHTTDIFENILFKIKNEIDFPIQKQPKLLSLGETVWPTSYFFFNEPNYSFMLGHKELTSFDYILSDLPNEELDLSLSTRYQKIIVPMRHWWLPDYEKLSLLNWINYALTQNPWSDTGAKDIALYSKINTNTNSTN